MKRGVERALVTGANRGMGEYVARELARRGMETWWLGRSARALDEAARGVEGARTWAVDLSDPGALERALEEMVGEGGVDVLVNNAAIYPDGGVLSTDDETWERAMQVNFLAPMALTRALVPGMVARGRGRVVQVSSGYGAHSGGLAGPGAYAVSKAALNAFTRKIAGEISGDVKVNAVCPGWVRTRMGGAGATRSIEQGTSGILWAATLPSEGPTGGFFRDGRPIDW